MDSVDTEGILKDHSLQYLDIVWEPPSKWYRLSSVNP